MKADAVFDAVFDDAVGIAWSVSASTPAPSAAPNSLALQLNNLVNLESSFIFDYEQGHAPTIDCPIFQSISRSRPQRTARLCWCRQS